MTEHDLHRSVAEYLTVALPDDVYWFHPANEGKRTKWERGQFIKYGGKAGVPDLVFVVGGQARFIELKAEGGYLSPAQKLTIEQIADAGAAVEVCRSILDVQETLEAWGVKIRARAA
ncbi:MAG: hypothetical protein GEU76_03900 [Alphaproteobacteria bacterium]|nr:hypothetical protein [Alphaproteobacteria bacterium]